MEIFEKAPAAHAQRLLELNYLANIVLAGLVELQKRDGLNEDLNLVILFKVGWKMYRQKE